VTQIKGVPKQNKTVFFLGVLRAFTKGRLMAKVV
jgi:hypothetical protein